MDIASALELDEDPAEAAVILGEPLYVGGSFASFEPNFEGAMRSLFGEAWSRLIDEAVASVGDSKPLRARYAVQRLDAFDWLGPPTSRFDRLARAIRGEFDGEARAHRSAELSSNPSPEEQGSDPWGEPPF